MHVDIDAFFASVEQLRNPHLRGKPVIVGSGVIASCSYEARRYGLRAGMPLGEAKRLCPHAVILEGHYPTYRCFADRAFELCRLIAPNIETGLDDAYCDLTGTERIYRHPLEAGRLLKETIRKETGLSVTVGIGSNRMIARMASGAAKPDGLALVEPGTEEEFVRDLPVEKLPGVGRMTAETLHMLNIRTIGEMRRMSREALRALFGANGLLLHERCRGRDTRVVADREIPRSISRETTFHRETADPREIRGMLHYLAERAGRTMRQLGIECRSVKVHIRYSDFADAVGSRRLPRGTDLDRDIYVAALDLLERLFTRRVNLRHIGITLSRFAPVASHQAEIFEGARDRRSENLYACLDELRRRFGHSIVVAGDSLGLLGRLRRDPHGYLLRTPCLTK